ncbi:competence protein CoiA family protein [Polaribacter aquimarinus]|nr:competence protein CoiA family protein [Polaribacter aquimarinus]
MLKSNIKYPVAFDSVQEKLIEISKVNIENKENLICKDCNESFVAVLNHQTPHFKHKPKSNCTANFESYVHWVTKELFKEIKSINVPELLIDDLFEKQREKFQLLYNKIIDSNIPEELRFEFKNELKRNLTDAQVLQIDKIETEKEYKTDLGNVLIDIVTLSHNEKVFIEPFFSNPINQEKKNKLSEIDTSTLMLNLFDFIEYFGSNFELETLKKYLISDEGKNWVYIKKEDFDIFLNNYENYLSEEIKRFNPVIVLYENKKEEILKINNKLSKLFNKKDIIEKKISILQNKVYDLGKEI